MSKLKRFVSQVKPLVSLVEVSPFPEDCPSNGTRRAKNVQFVSIATAFLLLSSASIHGQFVERVDVSISSIDVVVTDGKGKPVLGLTRNDFEVYEDGKLQVITNFSAIEGEEAAETPDAAGAVTSPPADVTAQRPPPRLIVLFIDIDDIEPIRRRQFFEGVAKFLDSGFREGDLFTMFTWSRRIRVAVPPTSSRTQVEAFLDGLSTATRWSDDEILDQAARDKIAWPERNADLLGEFGLDADADAAFQEFIIAETRCATIKRKATELRDLVASLVRVDMHKVLLFASDDVSLRPSRDCSTEREFDALAEAANAYGMTIHAFHPPGARERRVGHGPDSTPGGTGMPSITAPSQMAVESNKTFDQAGGLLHLAEQTGGLSGVGAGMSARVLEQAAMELDNYYSIGYRFSSGNEDTPRKLRVTTKNAAYRVRARKSVVRLSETSRLRDELTANLYLPPKTQSQSPDFLAKVDRIERDGRFALVHLELSISARDLVLLSSPEERRRGSFSGFVAGGMELGDASPVAELKQDFDAAKDVGDSRVMYAFTTRVRPDTRRLSIAVRDNISGEVATKVVMLRGSAPEGSPRVEASTTPVSDTAPGPAMKWQESDAKWQEALRRARSELKPILVFSHPEPCAPDARVDPCEQFAEITSHPAMQRRLANVIYLETALAADQEASVSVYDPSGTLAVNWFEFPRLNNFLKMLELVDGARPHLIGAHEAAMREDQQTQKREWAMAMLALGKAVQGRQLLEAVRESPDQEDQQLAVIWLAHLDAHQQRVAPSEDLFVELARTGSTDHVRFEAWMAAGNLRTATGRIDEAIQAYSQALDLASGANYPLALAALRQAEESASSVLGFGEPGSIIVGRRTIQPRATEKSTVAVKFRLDGRLVATAKRAPFATSIDFGSTPQRQILDVTALNAEGNVDRRQRVVVNRRSDEFSVRIVEPSSHELSGEVDIAVATQIPRGRLIESVTVEWNGERVASLTSAPYRTNLRIDSDVRGILRAVLKLDDGSETEDVLLVNAGAMTMASQVNLVEVPVYLERWALSLGDLSVKEEGQQRQIDRIIPAGDAPLRIAIVLDASHSMEGHILDVQEAALRFVETQLEGRDQVMVVAFNEAARILWPTNDRLLIEKTILSIDPRGLTSLHDAMTMALLQIPSTGSRRALVVFSDGMDTNSLLSAGDVAEVARRSGVPIYVLSLRPSIGPHTPRMGRAAVMIPTPYEVVRREQGRLRRVTRSTGGRMFDLESLETLEAIWEEIGADLRKQSLVIYRTEPSGSEWRPIEVSMKGAGRLRAPAGVYVAGETRGKP